MATATITETKLPAATAVVSRIDASEAASGNRPESAELASATHERNRLRGALLQAIVNREARRRHTHEACTKESTPTEGTANSRVEAFPA